MDQEASVAKDQTPSLPESAALVTINEAKAQLRCGRRKIFELHQEGKLEVVKLGSRTYRVTQRSLDKIIGKLPPVTPQKWRK